MDKVNLAFIATTISLFISLFLAVFLLTVKTKHRISNVLFAVYLILTAIDMSEPLINLMADGPSNLGMFKTSLAFLQIPVFYLYILSVCYSDFKLKPKYIFHLLPFLAVNLILLPRFYSVDVPSKIDFIINRKSMIELQFSHILFHIQMATYFIAVFVILRRTKKLYLENYAGPNMSSYKWLFQLTVVLTVLYLIVLLKNIFKFSDYQSITDGIKIAVIPFQLLIICWYLYKALNHPDLFRNIHSKLKLVADIILEEEKNKPEIINEEEILKLKKYMTEEKPFLSPSFTIQEMAKTVEIPVRELSLLINHQLGQHFYDFVNAYRIEYAIDILKDSSKSKVTILEILYETGFNSKSSFNTAFKKHTGHTPTNYRKALINNPL